MGNIFNDDFRDFIKAFNDNDVEYLLVGGMAVILHGYVRTTGDMHIWVRKSEHNYKKIFQAFYDFRMPVFDMTLQAFLGNKADVWSFGRQPVKIEILTEVKGLNFDEAFLHSKVFTEESLKIRFLYLDDLLKSKKASGRYKDLDDVEQLTKE